MAISDGVLEMLETSAAADINRGSQHNTNFLALADRVFTKLYTEPDPMEAAATRQIMQREAPINAERPAAG